MKRSSSPSDPGPGLFDEVVARGPVRAAVSGRAWLVALLDAEAALARAQAALGIIPAEAATAISTACIPDRYDLIALARAAAGPGNPVQPTVQAIRAAVPTHAKFVHRGATSQDILDTAAMLVSFRALGVLNSELAAATDAVADLARRYRGTPMAGRTLLQVAMPVTLGFKAAGWLVALDEAMARLVVVRTTRLAAQLGGPVGTLDQMDHAGLDLLDRFAAELGLATPLLPWHTNRTRVADLAGALGSAAGVVGKVARDITLLAQSEVGEMTEGDRDPEHGRSSAMAHKRNPIAAVAALACAAQAPGLCATLLAAMVQEHERAAGAWHAEWRPLCELLTCVGSAVAWLRESLARLSVNEPALAANLGRLSDTAGLEGAAGRLGLATELVDRALAAHADRKGDT